MLYFAAVSMRVDQETDESLFARSKKLGGLVIGMDKNFGLYGKQVQGLSWIQRMWWFYYPFRTLTLILVTLGLFTGPFFMLSGVPPVVYATEKDLKVLAQASALSFICNFLLKCHMALKTGYKALMMEQCNEIWIAPCKYIPISTDAGTATDHPGIQTILSHSFKPIFCQPGWGEWC